MNTKLTKLATMGAAATAIGAVGIFAVQGVAQAGPMAPLPLAPAPACDSYGFNGAAALSQDNGWAVQFNSTGPSATGPATASSDTGTQMHGTLTGGIKGHAVDFTINWDGGLKGRYVGYVNEDGSWTGTTGDSGWKGLGPLQCLTPTNPVPPQPEQVPLPRQGVPTTLPQAPPPPPAAANVATVISDVDVYDKPNDNDDATYLGILRNHSQVQIPDGCQPKAWCHVVGAAVPTGEGYVWGALQF